MKVLVTGAAGSIGSVVMAGLADRGHTVVGLDLVPPTTGEDWPWHTVDSTDAEAVDEVFAHERPGGVVHLAGNPGEASLPDSLTSHVVSTAALLDAMVAHGCDRIAYASSNHAVGRTPRTDLLGADAPPRPDTFYGVAKVAAEALLRLYSDRYGIDVVACRIGSFESAPETVRNLATWLSPDDCVRMFDAALTAPAPGFAVIYGISANTRAWWDLAPGRVLGYDPHDDAETYVDQIEPRTQDAAEAAYVGGPMAEDSLNRPALDH